MIAGMASDAVLFIHLAFIIFVAVGGLFVIRKRWVAWIHFPCAVWGALVELAGWVCPLTPLENRLRIMSGRPAYSGGFIDRYIVPVVYPEGLTRDVQVVLGMLVIVLNVVFYYAAFLRKRDRKGKKTCHEE